MADVIIEGEQIGPVENVSVMEAIGLALRVTRKPFRDCLDWEARTENGMTLSYYGSVPATGRVFINRRAGVSASDNRTGGAGKGPAPHTAPQAHEED